MDADGVVPRDDLSPADWVLDELTGFGGRVRDVVATTQFEAVARVLHVVDPGPPVVRWSDVAAHCGTVLHPLAQFWMLSGSHARSTAARGWPGGSEPDTGSVDRATLSTLSDVLLPHTTTPRTAWFGLWEGWGRLPRAWRSIPKFRPPARAHLLFSGAVADVVDLAAGFQSPSLWWPDDRAWCVATEIDFDSTLVAGSAALVEALVGHPDLEAFGVRPDDSLQYDGDQVNMR